MRDYQLPGRSPVLGVNAMAATSNPLATLTAVDVLRDGGNAVDAAVAAAAVLCVVEPHMTGVGGDCFVLYAPSGSGKVIALNGSGRAPAAADPHWFLDQGISSIASTSPHAVTVPGAVAAWSRLVSDHGRLRLDRLLRPAIEFAETGYPIYDRVAQDWQAGASRLRGDTTAARIFLPNGHPPQTGSVHYQPELADTLRAIAESGPSGFYNGPVAEGIVDYLNGLGGLHTLDDFAEATADYVIPIKTNYRGYDIYECPPNGQGIVALIMLNILAGFDLAALDRLSSQRLHLEVEAARLAFRDRDSLIADPAAMEMPVDMLLSADYAAELRVSIDPHHAIDNLPPSPFPTHRDTVYLTVVDADRNAVSFINSIFDDFGTGLVSPRTGIVLHSRGSSFVLDPAHPNCIGPRKRPLHTIMPGMVFKDDAACMPFGVMGAHYQPYGHVHFLTNVIDFGMDVQEALDHPRVFYEDGRVVLERGIPDSVADELAQRGHGVVRATDPLGGGQAIWIGRGTGVLTGGSDPRKDGCALGY